MSAFAVVIFILVVLPIIFAYLEIGFVNNFFFAPKARELVTEENFDFRINCINPHSFELESTDYNKAYLLCNWVRSKFNGDSIQFLLFRFFNLGTTWLFFMGEGRCGEASNLYNYMGRAVGLDVREIRNDGENHQWNEVYLDGTWVHIDPSIGLFNYPDYYEKNLESNKQYSYAYWVDEKGQKQSVTEKYTETSELHISVVDKIKKIENAIIELKSKNEKYPANNTVITGVTNADGDFTVFLGDNNYELIVTEPTWLGLFARQVTKQVEHKSEIPTTLEINLNEKN